MNERLEEKRSDAMEKPSTVEIRKTKAGYAVYAIWRDGSEQWQGCYSARSLAEQVAVMIDYTLPTVVVI